jgi:hypothetical protein
LMTGSMIMSFLLFLDGMIVEKALSAYSPMIWRNSLFYQIVYALPAALSVYDFIYDSVLFNAWPSAVGVPR